jgi:tetratricopeptide (TPR) repeat protein
MHPAEMLAGIFLMTAPGLAAATEPNHSTTVLGSANPQLARGAELLEAGDVEEGIRLTLEGLSSPTEPTDRAAAHANLCAGYALLKRWTEALPHCNASLELNHSNWRAFNNRAHVYTAMGQFDLAIRDVRAGLDLAPRSRTLLESLRIIEHNRRVTGRRNSSSARS